MAERLPDDADDEHHRSGSDTGSQPARVQGSPRDDASLPSSAGTTMEQTHGQHQAQLYRADPRDLVVRMTRELVLHVLVLPRSE